MTQITQATLAVSTSVTFPTVEAALAHLGTRVLGAEIRIVPPAVPTVPEPNDLEAEAQRLHALWHEAVTDAMEQREEVKRLAGQRDAYYKDVVAYSQFTTDIAAALGMGTMEISFKEVRAQVEELNAKAANYKTFWGVSSKALEKTTAERKALHAEVERLTAKIKELDASETKYQNYWDDACLTLRGVKAERDSLKARVAELLRLV